MKKNRRIIVAIGIAIVCIMIAKEVEPAVDIFDVYYGVTFRGRIIDYARMVAMYLCYSVLIYDTFRDYIAGYGIICLIRTQKRKKILNSCYIRLVKEMLFVEVIKMGSFGLILLLLGKSVRFDNFISFFFFLGGIFIFLSFQMLLELLSSSNLALAISNIFFILNLTLGDRVNFRNEHGVSNCFVLTSNMLDGRRAKYWSEDIMYLYSIGAMILTIIAIYIVSRIMIKRKNFV